MQRDRINIIPPKGAGKTSFTFTDKVRKQRARSAIRGINLDLLPRLGVLQCNDADVRQDLFSFVVNVDGDKIVSPSTYGERSRKIRRLKIRYEKDSGASRDDFV